MLIPATETLHATLPLGAGLWLGGEAAAWAQAAGQLFSAESVPALGISLGLALGALILSLGTVLGLHSLIRKVGFLRWPTIFLAQAMAFFPFAALVWAALGYGIGLQGWRVESLMPLGTGAISEGGVAALARVIWTWAPPVFLLVIPLTGALLSRRMQVPEERLHVPLRRVALFAVLLLPVVETLLGLEGAAGQLVRAISRQDGVSFLQGLLSLASLALLLWTVITLLPRELRPWVQTRPQQVWEGALAIGLSPLEAWRRHLFPRQLHAGLARALALLAWAFALASSAVNLRGSSGQYGRLEQLLTGTLPQDTHPQFDLFAQAMHEPGSLLHAALPTLLCVLSLWGLSLIIAPRPAP